MPDIQINEVKEFWEKNPLSADAIPFTPGTPEFFEYQNALREHEETATFRKEVYDWEQRLGEGVLDVGRGTDFVVGLYARGGPNVIDIHS